MLGSWVRAPSGSPKEKPKGDSKRQVLQNQYFVGLFLLSFGGFAHPKAGIDGQKIVLNSYSRQDFQKRGTICRKLAERCRGRPFLKRGKVKKNGNMPIMARITIDGKLAQFNTKLEVNPKNWQVKTGKVSGRGAEFTRMNETLDGVRVIRY